jgi:probable aminopeptidase NPEPL1
VLGDGVAYAKKDLKCDIILDMATLTGAQVRHNFNDASYILKGINFICLLQGIATGKYHGAVLTNDEKYEVKAMAAGKTSGDLTFPVPFAPELHFTEFSSPVADMKNSVAVSISVFTE